MSAGRPRPAAPRAGHRRRSPRARPRWLELATSSDHKDVGRMFIGGRALLPGLALVEFLLIRAAARRPRERR